MRRKIIQLAGKTFVISIPSKWAKKQNLQKGQELEITETNNTLQITTTTNQQIHESKTTIDATELNSSLIWHNITAAYIKGTNEIEIQYTEKETYNPRTKTNTNILKYIAEITNTLTGMELIKHGNNHCILKEVTTAKTEEFENLQKRLFFNLCTLSKEYTQAIKNTDWQTLENYNYLEQNINKLHAYCSRLLNKGTYQKQADTTAHQTIINTIEETADIYTEHAKILIQQKPTQKELKNITELFEQFDLLIHDAYELFYDYQKTKSIKFYDQLRNLKEQIQTKLKTNKNTTQTHLFGILQNKITNILTTRIMLEIKTEEKIIQS